MHIEWEEGAVGEPVATPWPGPPRRRPPGLPPRRPLQGGGQGREVQVPAIYRLTFSVCFDANLYSTFVFLVVVSTNICYLLAKIDPIIQPLKTFAPKSCMGKISVFFMKNVFSSHSPSPRFCIFSV